MKVYLVVNTENAPGRVQAVFANEEDAFAFADLLVESHYVEERTVFQGQPPMRGYNQ